MSCLIKFLNIPVHRTTTTTTTTTATTPTPIPTPPTPSSPPAPTLTPTLTPTPTPTPTTSTSYYYYYYYYYSYYYGYNYYSSYYYYYYGYCYCYYYYYYYYSYSGDYYCRFYDGYYRMLPAEVILVVVLSTRQCLLQKRYVVKHMTQDNQQCTTGLQVCWRPARRARIAHVFHEIVEQKTRPGPDTQSCVLQTHSSTALRA